MKALILRNDADAGVATARALIDKGFQILSVDTLAVAHALIRIDAIDLLVMDERFEGQLTHAIGLSGERKNPYLSTILLSDRTAEETDDLFDLIPSLYGVVGAESSAELISKLALSSVSALDVTKARVAQNVADDLAEQGDELVGEEHAFNADRLILAASDLMPPEDDTESGAPCYADVAIAAPEMAEIAGFDQQITLERVEDVVMSEVAALFRNNPLPHLMRAEQMVAAEAR